MNPIFAFALQYLFVDEGGFSNDPDDSGGATKYGVTQRDLEKFLGHTVTVDDVKNMSKDLAAQVYEKFYWNPQKLFNLTNQAIATSVLDTCVLYGETTGMIMAQKALNEFGQKLDTDGVNGDHTTAALNSIQPAQFIPAFKDQILSRIERIIEEAPKDKKFRDDWTKRANRLLTLVNQNKTGGLT